MSINSNIAVVFAVINVFIYSVNGSPRINMKQVFSRSDRLSSFQYFSREDWAALPSQDVRAIKKPVPYVVIHHTYKPDACNTTEQCFAAMRSMQNYHQSLGWGDIGYNFCLGSNGGVYEGRGWDNIGIHAGRANNFSIGICLIGDWRVSLPPKEMLRSTKKLISIGVKNGSISPDYKLIGHKQVMATECPGGALFNEISTWDHFVKGAQDFTTNWITPSYNLISNLLI